MNTLKLRDKSNKFGTIYYGQVKVIDDPTKQGRIKVKLPEIFGDSDPNQTPWIYPIGYNSGLKLFNVPDLDSEVGIIFIEDFYTGFYGIGKYSKGEAKVFDEDYPNVYGFEDAQGNYLIINKKSGEVKFHHKSGTEFTISDEGNSKALIKGNFELEAEGSLKMKGKDLTIQTEGNTDIKSAQVNLGEGGKRIARIGDSVAVDGKSHVGTITGGGTNTSI